MIQLTRRRLAASLVAAPLAAGLAGTAAARPAGGVRSLPPVASRRIGRFQVTSIADGFIDLPYEVFTGVEPAELAAEAEAMHVHRPTGVRSSFTAWLIDDGERLVLVDTGTAGLAGDGSGRLPEALAALGVTPAEIDAVIVTHMHFDHISGLVAGGRPVFANASVHVDRRDLAFFTDPAAAAAAPDLLASSFAQSAKVAELYPDIQALDGGERELLPGLWTVDLAGHTPGHTGVRVADQGQSLLLVGDMLFHPVIHPARPDVGILFEADPAASRAMRERFYPKAAEEQALVAATHMPFPGTGRIIRDGDGYAWLPADWDHAG
jgi:glyoxylase-like metal-dependent hydrolase (beta-lactamase superfamily II)